MKLAQPRHLWFLVLAYTMIMLLANWFDVRLIRVFNINTDAGILIFPLTFLLSDLITEVYGYQQARRAIWCGFLFNIIFILYGQLVTHLPSPDFALMNNQQFDKMMSLNLRITIASIISYLLAEPLNAFTMAKLKLYFAGKKLALRFVSSTIIASAADTVLFCTIAFYGLIDNQHLPSLILSMWAIKVAIEVFGLPLSLFLTKRLKKAEKMDIYDKQTNFSFFNLRVNYKETDNCYA